MNILEWIILAALIIVCAGSGIFVGHQLLFGLNKTALNDKYLWGLNIQGFYFLSSLGIGILSILSITILYVGTSYPVFMFQKAAVWAFACLVSAQVLMGADLGRPFRALKIITSGKFKSPLTLDFFALFFLTLLSLVFLFGIFMEKFLLLMIWAWVTLIFSFLSMIVHVLLFVPRVGAGYNSKPFSSAITISCGLWGGSAVLIMMSLSTYPAFTTFFELLFAISTVMVFISAIGGAIGDFLAGEKPNNMVLLGLSFIVLLLVSAKSIVLIDLPILYYLEATLALIAIAIEKYQTVTHIQMYPVLPMPYSLFEKKPAYKPSFSEWMNIVFGFSAVGVIVLAMKVFKVYILPYAFQLLGI